jgi:hypothetical protein
VIKLDNYTPSWYRERKRTKTVLGTQHLDVEEKKRN